nr:hypothetical protein [uncultured Acetatifactor sp.]
MVDLTYLTWTLSRNSSGTAGSFLKSYEQSGGVKYYYKLSNFDTVRGIYGHECLNEIVAQNIAAALKIPHLEYDLFSAEVKIDGKHYRTWLTRSTDFKTVGEHKLAFETYYEMTRLEDEDVWTFILRNQLNQYFYNIFILDYLICNRDRHGANIEVLEKKGAYRMAPVFDNGLSLLFSCYDDGKAMESFDRRKDGPVNNYVGAMSLTENLRKVPSEMVEEVLNADLSEAVIFKGMENVMLAENEAVPRQYWGCIRDMIRERRDDIAKIFH